MVEPEHVPTHLQHEHGRGERKADPEAPGEVHQLRVRPGVLGRHVRLQGHAADRAVARPDLAHLRVHRASVNGARRGWRGLGRPGRLGVQVARWVGHELRATAGRAEVEHLAVMFGAMLGGSRVHCHATDGIGFRLRGVGKGRARCRIAFWISQKPRPTACRAEINRLPSVLRPMRRRRRIDLHAAHGVSDPHVRRRGLLGMTAAAATVVRVAAVIVCALMIAHVQPFRGRSDHWPDQTGSITTR